MVIITRPNAENVSTNGGHAGCRVAFITCTFDTFSPVSRTSVTVNQKTGRFWEQFERVFEKYPFLPTPRMAENVKKLERSKIKHSRKNYVFLKFQKKRRFPGKLKRKLFSRKQYSTQKNWQTKCNYKLTQFCVVYFLTTKTLFNNKYDWFALLYTEISYSTVYYKYVL